MLALTCLVSHPRVVPRTAGSCTLGGDRPAPFVQDCLDSCDAAQSGCETACDGVGDAFDRAVEFGQEVGDASQC